MRFLIYKQLNACLPVCPNFRFSQAWLEVCIVRIGAPRKATVLVNAVAMMNEFSISFPNRVRPRSVRLWKDTTNGLRHAQKGKSRDLALLSAFFALRWTMFPSICLVLLLLSQTPFIQPLFHRKFFGTWNQPTIFRSRSMSLAPKSMVTYLRHVAVLPVTCMIIITSYFFSVSFIIHYVELSRCSRWIHNLHFH